MTPTIFFDMDGVLADFVRGALAVHSRRDIAIKDVPWGLEALMGIEPSEFWAPMGFDFWASLGILNDGMKLLEYTEAAVGIERIGLLTSPCDTRGCYDGKKDWVKRHLPRYTKSLFTGQEKFKIAGQRKILVDDNDHNCQTFDKFGGTAILVPRPWNLCKEMTNVNADFDPQVVFRSILMAL